MVGYFFGWYNFRAGSLSELLRRQSDLAGHKQTNNWRIQHLLFLLPRPTMKHLPLWINPGSTVALPDVSVLTTEKN
jgi:hypothetical protein